VKTFYKDKKKSIPKEDIPLVPAHHAYLPCWTQ